jgi:hypothetical protein
MADWKKAGKAWATGGASLVYDKAMRGCNEAGSAAFELKVPAGPIEGRRMVGARTVLTGPGHGTACLLVRLWVGRPLTLSASTG